MDDNVIVVQFDEPSKAYQALSELNRMGSEGKVDVKSAVLLERSKDGTVQTPEGADNAAGYYLASGGLIGLLVGGAALRADARQKQHGLRQEPAGLRHLARDRRPGRAPDRAARWPTWQSAPPSSSASAAPAAAGPGARATFRARARRRRGHGP